MQWCDGEIRKCKTKKRMASSATATSGSSSSTREGTAKAMVFDQISQTIQSTSNLLHLMQQSSTSQVSFFLLLRFLSFFLSLLIDSDFSYFMIIGKWKFIHSRIILFDQFLLITFNSWGIFLLCEYGSIRLRYCAQSWPCG